MYVRLCLLNNFDGLFAHVPGLKSIPDCVSGHLYHAQCLLSMHARDAVYAAVRNGPYIGIFILHYFNKDYKILR